MQRIILHIDMDAFFASVEQQVNPRLRNRPIAVTGSGKRTVINCPSYEARAFGVKTGMTRGEAGRLCPEIVFVPSCNQRYVDTCTGLVEIYKRYTPLVEVYSIDEVFLDVTGSARDFADAADTAAAIKRSIKETYSITASVGAAPNKLLAKIISDREKPDGLTVIKNDCEARLMLEDMPVKEVTGIGRRLEQHLGDMGITTCGQLSRVPVRDLRARFGVVGEKLHFMARGIDDSPIIPVGSEPHAKSIGHSMTFQRDISDMETLKRYILLLSERVARRLRGAGCMGRTVALTVRYCDFSTFTRRRTVGEYQRDGMAICELSLSILRSFRLKRAVRLLGVSISNLAADNQVPLFTPDLRRRRLTDTLDSINDRFGEFTVIRGALLKSDSGSGTISPAWRPAGIKRIDY